LTANSAVPGVQRIVVMGVAGSGKSTVGRLLAARLGAAFVDGDDLHPASNVEKMRRGEPLNDADRAPWLDEVGRTLARGERVVVACSALKRVYRDRIRAARGGEVTFVHLSGDKALVAERMAARKGHFMPLSQLDNQYATLEPLRPDEAGLTVQVMGTPAEIAADVESRLEL
jgi:gluconokinase